ncbi:MAG: MerR family transcriptional regulator [Peptococcales bacterium]
MSSRLTVREVSNILQVEESTLRFWEKEFEEYLSLDVQKGQRKRYSQRQLEVLSKIKELLHTEQYTIKGAKRRLDLDNTIADPLGIEHNFKTTVVYMLSSIMKELQKTQEDSRKLSQQVELLRREKNQIAAQLAEEQSKSIVDILKQRLSTRHLAEE